jgi:hypothetical protein
MSKTITFSTIAVLALAGATFFGSAEPSAARNYEYCRYDYVSHIRSCSFDTMEQCLASASGRGGTCDRDPFLSDASGSYAYVKGHGRRPAPRPE